MRFLTAVVFALLMPGVADSGQEPENDIDVCDMLGPLMREHVKLVTALRLAADGGPEDARDLIVQSIGRGRSDAMSRGFGKSLEMYVDADFNDRPEKDMGVGELIEWYFNLFSCQMRDEG